jgi:predicted O-linked N-acetylglucosamine transferase (SPINDLY family)
LPLFDEVHQAFCLSDFEIAALARKRSVDIAIDLNGYTAGARTSLFAFRPAPVQINFLGYPGTMGTSFHDFIVADAIVIPDSEIQAYTEKVLRLPHFFMPYDFRSPTVNPPQAPSRNDFGLPPDAFVFCSFNDVHKITQEMLSTWIQILRETQNTVLWFALRGEISSKELRTLFESEGIPWERIILASRVESAEHHLARLGLADLMLDTFPYNSHTTACDAIKSGLPVLTLTGNSFQSRVCSSLLHHLGAPSLIAQSMEEYRKKAVALAKDPTGFAEVKTRFHLGRSKRVESARYAQALEQLYASALSSHSK